MDNKTEKLKDQTFAVTLGSIEKIERNVPSDKRRDLSEYISSDRNPFRDFSIVSGKTTDGRKFEIAGTHSTPFKSGDYKYDDMNIYAIKVDEKIYKLDKPLKVALIRGKDEMHENAIKSINELMQTGNATTDMGIRGTLGIGNKVHIEEIIEQKDSNSKPKIRSDIDVNTGVTLQFTPSVVKNPNKGIV